MCQNVVLCGNGLKEFANNTFKFDLNGAKCPKRVENTVEKGEIAQHKQFLLFPECFGKDLYYRHVKPLYEPCFLKKKKKDLGELKVLLSLNFLHV